MMCPSRALLNWKPECKIISIHSSAQKGMMYKLNYEINSFWAFLRGLKGQLWTWDQCLNFHEISAFLDWGAEKSYIPSVPSCSRRETSKRNWLWLFLSFFKNNHDCGILLKLWPTLFCILLAVAWDTSLDQVWSRLLETGTGRCG